MIKNWTKLLKILEKVLPMKNIEILKSAILYIDKINIQKYYLLSIPIGHVCLVPIVISNICIPGQFWGLIKILLYKKKK